MFTQPLVLMVDTFRRSANALQFVRLVSWLFVVAVKLRTWQEQGGKVSRLLTSCNVTAAVVHCTRRATGKKFSLK